MDIRNSKTLLKTENGDQATILTHGAHIISWIPKDSENNQLYLSTKSHFKEGTAIRGGVPILFPQFGNAGNYQKHGFARNIHWSLVSEVSDKQSAVAEFTLQSDSETHKLWPFNFSALYQVEITANKLRMMLQIKNTDNKDIEFTNGLHSYFAIESNDSAQLEGFENIQYRDLGIGDWKNQKGKITFESNLDRVYKDSQRSLILHKESATFKIEQTGFGNTVIWNPGSKHTPEIPDIESDGYKKFVCIEPANFDQPTLLKPNEEWQGTQTIIFNKA